MRKPTKKDIEAMKAMEQYLRNGTVPIEWVKKELGDSVSNVEQPKIKIEFNG